MLVGCSGLPKSELSPSEQKFPETYINDVAQIRRGDVRDCYNNALQKNPNLSGKITFSWEVLPAGTVRNTRLVENTKRDVALSKCIDAKIHDWTFPKFQGRVRVVDSFPFWFEPARN